MSPQRSARTHVTVAGTDRVAAIGIAAALAATVLILYAQTGQFEFVTLDDYVFIADNPPVAQGLTWAGVRWAFTEAYSPNWHPVTWLSHMVDCSWFGLRPGPPHLVSAALHALNAVLLFVTWRMFTGALWPSAAVAALFAVHPMRAESVAWLSERKDVVSGLFWILTMLAYARYARRPSVARYTIVAGLFALGLMSKPMLVSLPAILLLLDRWPLERWRSGQPVAVGVAPGRPANSLARLVVEKLPLLALAGGAGAITVYTQQLVGGVRTVGEVSLGWRVVNALTSYVAYLRKTIWPSDLAAIYPHPALIGAPLADAVWRAAGAGLLLLAITGLCLSQWRQRPYLSVGWLWFAIALLPVIGLTQVGMQSMADRYLYVPAIGLYVIAAWGGRDLTARWPHGRAVLAAATAVAIVAYATASWFQIGTWRDSETLYRHALAVTRDNYLAEAGLGAWLMEHGRFDEADRHLREALRIRPQEPYTLTHYGALRQDEGDLDGAAQYHEAALRQNPDYAQALANLGVVRLRQGRLEDAEAQFIAALRIQPLYPLAEANLGATLLQAGRFDAARAHLRRALALGASSAEIHTNLGVALARQGDWRAAAAEFTTALQLDPHHVSAARNLEIAHQRLNGG